KILSFCSDLPFSQLMSEQDIWNANKLAIVIYRPTRKDLKLIWERDPKTERIIRMFQSLRDLGTEDSISFSFGDRHRTFYVLNIPNKNIREFQESVSAFPATPVQVTPAPFPERGANMFTGGRGIGKGKF